MKDEKNGTIRSEKVISGGTSLDSVVLSRSRMIKFAARFYFREHDDNKREGISSRRNTAIQNMHAHS